MFDTQRELFFICLFVFRHILAVLHFNFNLQRHVKKREVNGAERVKLSYPKFKNGEATGLNARITQNFGKCFLQFWFASVDKQVLRLSFPCMLYKPACKPRVQGANLNLPGDFCTILIRCKIDNNQFLKSKEVYVEQNVVFSIHCENGPIHLVAEHSRAYMDELLSQFRISLTESIKESTERIMRSHDKPSDEDTRIETSSDRFVPDSKSLLEKQKLQFVEKKG